MMPVGVRSRAQQCRRKPPAALGALVICALFGPNVSRAADPLHIVDDRVFQVRAYDGPNNVGVAAGDNILTGAWLSPVAGTVLTISQVSSNGSIYSGSGTATWGPFELQPLNSPALPFEFSATYAYGPAAASGLLGPWTFSAVNPGSANTPFQFQSPSIANASLMALATNVRLSSAGGAYTVSWSNPTPASFIDIHLHDLSLPREYFGQSPDQYIGFAPIVHEESSKQPGADTSLPGTATSFVIPTTFSSGLTFDPSHRYAVSIIRYQTEVQTVNGETRPWVVNRSRTFANFAVGTGSGYTNPPAEVFLPTVTSAPDFTGTQFSFDIAGVGTGLTFIDPDFALGYEYIAGEGDPSFRSVMLPHVGDGVYRVEVFDPTTGEWHFVEQVQAEQELLFQSDVRRFRVLGIEASAGLDPNDPTAFITGLSFVGDGRFTGRMIAVVPEPGTWALLFGGLALLALRRRPRVTR
jgi:hypothetical protein